MSDRQRSSEPDDRHRRPAARSGGMEEDREAAREAFEAFLGARVFCQATGPGAAPGVMALGSPGDGIVPVFTSLEELARFLAARGETEGADWFATTGEDLLGLIPDGYGVLLDPGTDHATLLHPAR